MRRWLRPVDLQWGAPLAPASPIRYHSPPVPLTGAKLLAHNFNVQPYAWSRAIERLPASDVAKLNQPDPRLFQEQMRIYKAYEIVEHQRRHGNHLNPYVGLGLHPWEIIKDKLRKQVVGKFRDLDEFEMDIYDEIIVFATTGKPLGVVAEVIAPPPKMPAWVKQWRDTGYVVRSRFTKTNFALFYARWVAENPSSARPLVGAASAWRAMPQSEKEQVPLPTRQLRAYKEMVLEIRLALVMDFICYGWLYPSHDWLSHYRAMGPGWTYMHQLYTDVDYRVFTAKV